MARMGSRRRSGPTDVLVVCTGNICRSPYIAARLDAVVDGLRVASAGTHAVVGEPPTPEVQRLLQVHGTAAPAARARQLTGRLVRDATVVVTATRAQRLEVLDRDPSAVARTFTLKELTRLVAGAAPGIGPVALSALAAAAVGHESGVEGGIEHDDDLDDPYGGEPGVFDRMAAEVEHALAVLAPMLRVDRG